MGVLAGLGVSEYTSHRALRRGKGGDYTGRMTPGLCEDH